MTLEEAIAVIRRYNPHAGAWQMGAALGVEQQTVEAALKRPSFAMEVAWVKKAISERGHIWEGCRPAFERGEYIDPTLKRLLQEGVLVPASDPKGGYVLPRGDRS